MQEVGIELLTLHCWYNSNLVIACCEQFVFFSLLKHKTVLSAAADHVKLIGFNHCIERLFLGHLCPISNGV